MSRYLRSCWPAAAFLSVIAVVAAMVAGKPGTVTDRTALSATRPLPREATFTSALASTPKWVNGVALPAVVPNLSTWQRRTGEHPGIVAIYINLANPFPVGQVKTILADGAMPLIQINPKGESLNALIAGRYDKKLAADRKAIVALHKKVAVSFGHEMNGSWYDWGCTHVKPKTFRTAWRRVHRKIGTKSVTWVWNPSSHLGRCGIASWYPGRAYVNWVGLDGYLRNTKAQFGRQFNGAISEIHHFAPGKAMFIAEAGTPVSARMVKQLRNLYSGARRAGMFGLVWFDGKTRLGNYQPWANGTFLRAFRSLVG